MQIPVIYVEKDYWITYALYHIFNSEISKDVIFKGGTALSKCYNLIERFSEDIDLVVLKRDGDSNSKMKGKLRKISQIVDGIMPEEETKGLTNKWGKNRKTVHTYNQEFEGEYGQVRDKIVLESTWLGSHEPYTTKDIVSFVGRMIMENPDQAAIAQEYGLLPFSLQVLKPERTICEKIMGLVRFSYSENPRVDLSNKIRHIYDLHQLLNNSELSDFFHSGQFDELLLRVANDDKEAFKNNNQWLVHHPIKALIFDEIDEIWEILLPVYSRDFSSLVYGTLPTPQNIYETLLKIKERLAKVEWSVKV